MGKYIEAEELLKRLNARKYSVEKTTRRQVAYNAAISAACRSVDMMPAADVQEVRRGRWVDRKFEDGEWYHTCSVCGMVLREDAFDNFCGNCGASMDKVTE